MAYRKANKAVEHKPFYKNPTRRLEVALMRLDRRYCARMIIVLIAAIFTVSGIMLGMALMVGIKYAQVTF